eukprot:Gb_11592 [translate_table: standard]
MFFLVVSLLLVEAALGVEEAIEAGKRISNIPVDIIFTSSLIRAQMTAMLAMTQHCRKKIGSMLKLIPSVQKYGHEQLRQGYVSQPHLDCTWAQYRLWPYPGGRRAVCGGSWSFMLRYSADWILGIFFDMSNWDLWKIALLLNNVEFLTKNLTFIVCIFIFLCETWWYNIFCGHFEVPVIKHNESEEAKAWSKIFSEDTKRQSIALMTAWQLNERMYGELQGLNKKETADKFGKEKVHQWCRSYDIPPPNGESLEMCAERAVAYFKEQIEPLLHIGKNVLIAAHGNSLRSIIMYLDKLTSQEAAQGQFINLELSTGTPMLYIFKEGKFIRRGSPIRPSEAGVYAVTRVCFVVP